MRACVRVCLLVCRESVRVYLRMCMCARAHVCILCVCVCVCVCVCLCYYRNAIHASDRKQNVFKRIKIAVHHFWINKPTTILSVENSREKLDNCLNEINYTNT